jgi:hypothetical protein
VRVTPDDEVYRVNTVWLGPSGLTFPWTARYLAYATWLITFLVILFVEAITPLSVNVPPIWELCLTTLFTYGVMGFVDHERPFKAVWQTFMVDLTTPRPGARSQKVRVQPSVRVRENRFSSGAKRRRRRARRTGDETAPATRADTTLAEAARATAAVHATTTTGTNETHPTDKRTANVGAV